MGCGRSNTNVDLERGTRDAARDGDHAPSPLREAELPLRDRRGAAQLGGAQLLGQEQDEVRNAESRGGGPGERGDQALPSGEDQAGEDGGQRARAADRQQATPQLRAGEDQASNPFSASDALYGGLRGFLGGDAAAGLTHSELEARLDVDGRELLCRLYQDHLDLRAERETRADEVRDAEEVAHRAVEAGHERPLTTIFGSVTVGRLAYRAKGHENLYLADATLNLPEELHSHGLRELAAIEATRGSYEEAQAAISRATGVCLGKRQVEELAARAAKDVEDFYDRAKPEPAAETDALVISVDGKGIVMRPGELREATKKAAEAAKHKLKTRLTRGEKKDRKRMAELAVVYDCPPVARSPVEVMARSEDGPKVPAPVAKAKWLTASVIEDAKEVIKAAFDEAERRDPEHHRPWVALVDGAKHQIDVIKAEARRRNIDITIVCDWIHVVEYIWAAARCFFPETDPDGDAFVAEKALAVLEGKAGIVAGAIGRKATMLHLDAKARERADECARYLKNKKPYLDYPKALAAGWPIATGVIEGACAHLVRDRMVFSSPRGGGFCPLRRQTVLVGYTSASYRPRRADLSRSGGLPSVPNRVARRPGVLERRGPRVLESRCGGPVPVRSALRSRPGGVDDEGLCRRAGPVPHLV